MSSSTRSLRSRIYLAIAAVLCVAGVAFIAASCASSRPGAPEPPANAAGTIEAGAPANDNSGAGTDIQSTEPTASDKVAPTESLQASPTSSTTSTADDSPTTTSTAPSITKATSAPETTKSTYDPAPPTSAPVAGPVLSASPPVSISIPAIDASSSMLRLGLNSDGSVEVPDLNEPVSKAGWYKNSPTPGEQGPSIILGHIDSHKYGPGIFYRLGDLRPDDTVNVTRKDGTVAVFRIDGVRKYDKDHFPTLKVYGNIDHAGLRLITCGGKFDPSIRSYESNIIAYATLVSSHPAK